MANITTCSDCIYYNLDNEACIYKFPFWASFSHIATKVGRYTPAHLCKCFEEKKEVVEKCKTCEGCFYFHPYTGHYNNDLRIAIPGKCDRDIGHNLPVWLTNLNDVNSNTNASNCKCFTKKE